MLQKLNSMNCKLALDLQFPGIKEMVDFTADENPFKYSEENLSKSCLLACRFGFKDHMYSQVMVLKLILGREICTNGLA